MRLRDLPVRRKLIALTVIGIAAGLLAASAAFVLYDRAQVREQLVRRLDTQADIIGANSVSALLFEDADAAARTLAGLRAEPHVLVAGIYDEAGRPFASWTRDGRPTALPPLEGQATRFESGALVLLSPVEFEGRRVGTVYIVSDLGELATRLRRYAVTVSVVMFASLLIGALVSARLQRGIVEPILRLATVARAVSRDRDYTMRAGPGRGDETGILVRTFNEMLDQIERRDAELQDARATLEARVAERTRDLERSGDMLAEAQRLAHVGSWDWEVGAREVVWSDEMYRIFGVDRRTYRPLYPEFLELVHPEDRTRLVRQLRRTVETGADFNAEYRVVRRTDGSLRGVRALAQALRDAEGRTVRLRGTAQDVTEQKAAEEERTHLIREQAARAEVEAARHRATYLAEVSAALGAELDFDATLATAARVAVPEIADWCVVSARTTAGLVPVAAHHLDPQKMGLLWEMARTTRVDPNDPGGTAEVMRTGQPRLFDAPPAFRQLADPEVRRRMEDLGLASSMIVSLRARNNVIGVMYLGARPPRRLGIPDLVLAQSVADRAALAADNARLYRDAQEASRMKDEFLATLSHELRTPLNAIVGWTRMLQSGSLPAEQARRAVDVIDRNARVQTQLIEDVLDVSRIVAGKLRLDVQPVDLPATVDQAIEAVRHAAEARQIRLHAELAPPSDAFRGDPARLQQVVWNLLSNAIKFTPRGGNVWVRLAESDGHVVIEVRDDGAGIVPAFLPHVFERFRQADSSSTRRHGGLGIGLAIVRHIAELHGGTVEAQSEGPGQGATFRVRLPLRGRPAAAPEPEAGHTPVPPSTDGLRLKGVRVLVVDDEPDTRELVRAVLEKLGADVTTAGSADEALASLNDGTPDALVSDIAMPGMDGYALMRRVRALPADRGGRVPAAALTAYARPEDRVAALTAGFQIHIPKPVQPDELAAVVASLTGRRSG